MLPTALLFTKELPVGNVFLYNSPTFTPIAYSAHLSPDSAHLLTGTRIIKINHIFGH